MEQIPMTITNYDHAVIDYFKDIYPNSVWGDPSTAFKNNAMAHEDKVLLPMISVYRSELTLNTMRNFSLFKKGHQIEVTDKDVTRERVLPLILSYQADVWATQSETAGQLFSEVLFYTLDKPAVTIQIGGLKEPVVNYLRIVDVIDNTDTTAIATRGRLNRFTLVYQMDAHIVKIERNDRIKVVPELVSFDGRLLK